MISYRNVYDGALGPRWSTPEGAVIGRSMCGVEDDNFLRVEMLFNGIPFRPPVGFTKREPTFLIRSKIGDVDGVWYREYTNGLTFDVNSAYEYTQEEIRFYRIRCCHVDVIPADEAYELG